MDEKRKYKRIIVEGMDVHAKMLFATEVNLLTISLGGASVSLHKRLSMGSEYTLKIECKDRTFSTSGVVVWERLVDYDKNEKGETVPIYEAGIRFKDVLTEKGTELIGFIEAIAAPETRNLRLKGTRARIIDPKKTTIVDYYTNFDVKKISLGGMLIETDHEIEVDIKFQMELIFPEERGSIKFRGRITSCMEIPGRTPNFYNTGIEFVEMSKEDRGILKEFINYLERL